MLCVKCGEEYEGASCPRCEGPQILVNNDDYLRRRKAYEEKQAAKRSASSGNGATQTAGEVDFVVQLASKVNKKIESNKKKSETTKRENTNKASVGQKPHTYRSKRYLKLLVVVGALIVLAIVIGAWLFSGRKSFFIRNADGIYELKKGKCELVCQDYDAYFSADNKCFYEMKLPQEYKDMVVKDRLASDMGKCAAAVVYDEDSLTYKALIIKEDSAYIITEGNKSLDVMYVTDNGTVVYTAHEMVNDEGYGGAYELYIYEATNPKKPVEGGTVRELTDDLKHTYVLPKVGRVLFVDSESNLLSYDYDKSHTISHVAEYISNVYVPDNEVKNKYSYYAGYVSLDATSVIYSESGKFYYMDFEDKKMQNICIAGVSGATTSIIYKKDEFVYSIEGNILKFITYNKVLNSTGDGYTTVYESKDVLTLNVLANGYWLDDKNVFMCISSDNKLCQISKGLVKELETEVLPGSFACVDGDTNSFVYCKGTVWCYIKTLGTKPVQMVVPEEASIKKVVKVKNKIYVLSEKNKLYVCSKDLKKFEEICDAEYVWCVDK